MSISIKTAREIEKMRRAGELLEKVHDETALPGRICRRIPWYP